MPLSFGIRRRTRDVAKRYLNDTHTGKVAQSLFNSESVFVKPTAILCSETQRAYQQAQRKTYSPTQHGTPKSSMAKIILPALLLCRFVPCSLSPRPKHKHQHINKCSQEALRPVLNPPLPLVDRQPHRVLQALLPPQQHPGNLHMNPPLALGKCLEWGASTTRGSSTS